MDAPPDWDDWVGAQGDSAGFLQTSTWAAIHRAANGAVPYYLSVSDGAARVAGTLVTHRPPGRALKDRLAGRGRGVLECFEGPVLPEADPAKPLAQLLTQLDALARRLRVRAIRFAGPPVGASWAGGHDIAAMFRQFGYREEAWLTRLVDLADGEAALLRSFKHAARQGIRKCADAKLAIVPCETFDSYMQDFRTPYADAVAADTGTRPHIADERAWWEIDSGRHYRFLVAKDPDGAVLATLGTYRFNGVATEIMSVRTPAGRNANLPAQDLLHWEAMRRHKAAGDRVFNLAGFSPAPRDEKEAGIRRFKEKWGGREVAVPVYTRGETEMLQRLARMVRGALPAKSAAARP